MFGIFLDEDSPILRAIHVHFTLLRFILTRFQLLFLIDDRRTQGVSNLYHLGTHSQFETDANKRRRKEKLWRRVTNKRSQLDETLSV